MSGATLRDVAFSLSRMLDRPVVDETGLPGAYEFELTWDPNSGSVSRAADDRASMFTALQEQLGLRLDSRKGPVEFLVIDSAESCRKTEERYRIEAPLSSASDVDSDQRRGLGHPFRLLQFQTELVFQRIRQRGIDVLRIVWIERHVCPSTTRCRTVRSDPSGRSRSFRQSRSASWPGQIALVPRTRMFAGTCRGGCRQLFHTGSRPRAALAVVGPAAIRVVLSSSG